MAGVDHRDVILENARRFHVQGENELACLLIATWTEHCVNAIIVLQCERIGMGRDEINNIIREVQMRGKITWLLKLINLPPIPTAHVKNIISLFEERNKYIHYKWKEFNIDEPNSERYDIVGLLQRYMSTVSYLKRYDSRNTLLGARNRIGFVAKKYINLTSD